jgi:hypothetical protein
MMEEVSTSETSVNHTTLRNFPEDSCSEFFFFTDVFREMLLLHLYSGKPEQKFDPGRFVTGIRENCKELCSVTEATL